MGDRPNLLFTSAKKIQSTDWCLRLGIKKQKKLLWMTRGEEYNGRKNGCCDIATRETTYFRRIFWKMEPVMIKKKEGGKIWLLQSLSHIR